MNRPKRTTVCISLVSLALSLRTLPAQAPAGDRPAEKLIIDSEDDKTYYSPVLRALPVANANGATTYIQTDQATGLPSVVLHRAGSNKSTVFTPGYGLLGFPEDYYVGGGGETPALNDNDDVAIAGGYSGPFIFDEPQDSGGILLLSRAGGAPAIVLRTDGPESEVYPGFGEVIMNNSRDFCFESGLTSTDRTTTRLVRALAPDYKPERVVRVGDVLPGAPAGTGYWPAIDIGGTGQRHVKYLNDFGMVAFMSFATANAIPGTAGIKGVNGIFRLPVFEPQMEKVVAAGDAAPGLEGTTFRGIDHFHMNALGELVLVAVLSDSSTSVWYVNPVLGLRPVAYAGQTVETNLGPLEIRVGASAKMISSAGAIPFVAGVSSEDDPDFVEAVLLWKPDGTYAVVARNQNTAPGLPGGYFVNFQPLSVDASNRVLFSAFVSTLNSGLWIGAPDGAPLLVAASGSRLRFTPEHQ